MDLTRRELIRRMGLLVAGSGMVGGRVPAAVTALAEIARDPEVRGGLAPLAGVRRGIHPGAPSRKIPLIHTTDLYDPPQDPDDQIDLATVLALDEYDLRGVVLDITEKFLHPKPEGWDIARKPGFASVARMGRITGRTIPVAQGPHHALAEPGDTCEDAPDEEQTGIRMILELLEASVEPVTISVTGSPRALTAAYNREPALLRAKTAAVLLNAGSTGGPKTEWNVLLDRQAYVGLWRSKLPIRWYPPGTESGAFNQIDGRGTYFRARQADLFRDLPPALRSYISDALESAAGPTEPAGKARDEDARWQAILGQDRNLWSTASLVMGAGRVLAGTRDGWRFVPAGDAGDDPVWSWRLDPIRATVDGEGRVAWTVADASDTRRWLFGRRPGKAFGPAMTEALNALLKGMTVR